MTLGAANASSADAALCAAGASIKIEDTPGKLHNKLMIADAGGTSPVVITGSLNRPATAAHRNRENTLLIHDPLTAQAYRQALAALWAGIDPPTPCNAEATPSQTPFFLPVAMRAPEASHQPTATATPIPSGPCSCSGNLYNCGDFVSQRAAQACFDWCMQEVGTDLHQLDADGDGVACESLPAMWRVMFEDGSHS